MKDRITIEGRDGVFGAYIARPKALPAAAVVVLQELFGVNADIRKTCDELAEQGFVASRPIYSGVRSRALTLGSRRRLTGSKAFAFIKPITEARAPGTLRTPLTLWLNCPFAPVRLRYSATASAA